LRKRRQADRPTTDGQAGSTSQVVKTDDAAIMKLELREARQAMCDTQLEVWQAQGGVGIADLDLRAARHECELAEQLVSPGRAHQKAKTVGTSACIRNDSDLAA
jgi:hypothetical protein